MEDMTQIVTTALDEARTRAGLPDMLVNKLACQNCKAEGGGYRIEETAEVFVLHCKRCGVPNIVRKTDLQEAREHVETGGAVTEQRPDLGEICKQEIERAQQAHRKAAEKAADTSSSGGGDFKANLAFLQARLDGKKSPTTAARPSGGGRLTVAGLKQYLDSRFGKL